LEQKILALTDLIAGMKLEVDSIKKLRKKLNVIIALLKRD